LETNTTLTYYSEWGIAFPATGLSRFVGNAYLAQESHPDRVSQLPGDWVKPLCWKRFLHRVKAILKNFPATGLSRFVGNEIIKSLRHTSTSSRRLG